MVKVHFCVETDSIIRLLKKKGGDWFTFCISFFLSGSPIITDDLHALDASIARTLDGQTESVLLVL